MMRSVLPNLDIPPLEILGLKIRAFNVMVAVAIIVGVWISQRRARVLGLDLHVFNRMLIWGIPLGFVIAHWFNDVFYAPHRIAENPLHLLKIWDGVASTGGILGGFLVSFLYIRLRHREKSFIRYWEAVMYGFAFAWIFGRLGCTIAYDHPGLETDFILGMEYQGKWSRALNDWKVTPGVRHNVGMYEMLWTMAVAAVMFAVRKRPLFPGWFTSLFFISFMLYRFPADYLRVNELKTLGLSGGQWAALTFGAIGIAIWLRGRKLAPMVPRGSPREAAVEEQAATSRT